MTDKSHRNIIAILIGLILWFIYICDSEMARYGIYTIFSYNVHEMLVIIPYLCFFITGGCLIVLFIRSFRGKNIKSNLFLMILLLVFCVVQFKYIHNRSQTTISTSCIATIQSKDARKLEIEIVTNDRTVTLDCPMLLIDILKTDGTEYGITYEWSKSKPNYGKLSMIGSIE